MSSDLDRVANGLLAELDARQLHQVVDRPGDPMRFGDHPLGHPAARRPGRCSSASASASTARAPTGVFSSWLMLATKSVRMASTRRRSLTSSIVATAEPPGSPSAVTTTASLRRTVQLEQLARRAAVEGLAQGGLNGVVDEQPGVRPGHRLGARVAVQHLAARTPSRRPRGGCDRPPPTTSVRSVGSSGDWCRIAVERLAAAARPPSPSLRRAIDPRHRCGHGAAPRGRRRTTTTIIRGRSPPGVRRSAPHRRTRGRIR